MLFQMHNFADGAKVFVETATVRLDWRGRNWNSDITTHNQKQIEEYI